MPGPAEIFQYRKIGTAGMDVLFALQDGELILPLRGLLTDRIRFWSLGGRRIRNQTVDALIGHGLIVADDVEGLMLTDLGKQTCRDIQAAQARWEERWKDWEEDQYKLLTRL